LGPVILELTNVFPEQLLSKRACRWGLQYKRL